MADLEDLGISSILDTSQDEAIERLRQIRLSRRIPVKTKGKKKSTKKSKPAPAKKLSQSQAANLLKLLEGEDQ